jgi:putative addiction module component (TIGR02574 family)
VTREAEEILRDALRLPPESRAAVAGHLIESLEAAVDENAEAEWSVEIARRLSELDSGSVRTIPWEEARRQLLGPLDAATRR